MSNVYRPPAAPDHIEYVDPEHYRVVLKDGSTTGVRELGGLNPLLSHHGKTIESSILVRHELGWSGCRINFTDGTHAVVWTPSSTEDDEEVWCEDEPR